MSLALLLAVLAGIAAFAGALAGSVFLGSLALVMAILATYDCALGMVAMFKSVTRLSRELTTAGGETSEP